MTSKLAIEDLEALRRRGYEIPVADVIRLNAAGLRLERNEAAAEWFKIPRACVLKGVAFRQPTVAHEIWLTKVRKVVELDVDSLTAVQIYALTRDADKLCDPLDREAVKTAVELALESVRGCTYDQIDCALTWVLDGDCAESDEAAPASTEPDENAKEFIRAADSIAIGYVHDALVHLTGITLTDAMKMTASELHAITVQAKIVQGVKSGVRSMNQLRGEYYAVLDAITAAAAKRKMEAVDNG